MPYPPVQGEDGDGMAIWQFVPCLGLILSLTLRQLDAGMYSGRDGIAALPYFDEFDLSTIDVLLISQYVPFLFLSDGVSKPLYPTVAFIAVQCLGITLHTRKFYAHVESRCLLLFHVCVKSCTSLDESQYKNIQTPPSSHANLLCVSACPRAYADSIVPLTVRRAFDPELTKPNSVSISTMPLPCPTSSPKRTSKAESS